jgi:hypothetical protein
LPGFPEHSLTYSAGWKKLRFLTKSLRVMGQTFFKGFNLFETVLNTASLLHRAAPLLGLGRERNRAFSSPTNATGRAVMGDSMERLKSQRCSVLLTRQQFMN